MVPERSRIQHLTNVSLLASAALVLSYLESMVPLPVTLPGVKLGLGNVAVVVALFSLGPRSAGGVAFAKVIASGLLFGSPIMMAYSLGGTLLAFAGMLALQLTAKAGPVAVSMAAAVLHNVGQISVAALLLENSSVFLSLAPLSVAACATGALTGAVAVATLAPLGNAAPPIGTPLLAGAALSELIPPLSSAASFDRLKHPKSRLTHSTEYASRRTATCGGKQWRPWHLFMQKRHRQQQRPIQKARTSIQKSDSFGVFRKGTSFAHRLDPRAKIVFAAFYLVSAYLADDLVGCAFVALVAVLVAVLSKMSWQTAKRTFKPFAWLVVFIIAFDALFVDSGKVLFHWGVLYVSAGGVAFGVESASRFLCVLLATSTLMSTTSPTALTDGFAALATPLRRFGAHVDDTALVMGLTLRFIPLFSEELARLRIAQSARLANFESGSFAGRVLALRPLATPLLAGALRRGTALATSIESRGFGATNRRTCLRQYRMYPADWATMAFGMVLAALCFAL